MLLRPNNCYNCSSVSWWLLISRVNGFGTSYRISGNSFSSIYFRSKHKDLPLEPMIPFLINISSFILRSF